MRIASFNIKHTLFQNTNILASDVFNVIKSNNIDVLCTQEIPRKLSNKFSKVMKGYSVSGDSRYHRYLKSLPFNEKNPIITKRSVVHTKTIRYKNKIRNIKEFFRYIKNIPVLPRIATLTIIKTDKDLELCIINTHLDYKLNFIQKKELDDLLSLINEYINKYPVILTGDFNMDINDKHFNDFIDRLNSIGVNKVDIKGYTWRGKKGNKKTLDYIFISNSLKVSDYGIIKSNDLSDHDLIYVDIDI